MKTYKVEISKMTQSVMDKSQHNEEFTSYQDAYFHFVTFADDMNMDYEVNEEMEEKEMEAGGIGSDYRIQLIIEQ